jgi:hypothetical protein
VLAGTEPKDTSKDLRDINRMLSGRMSDKEQENFDMKLFGTL